MCGRYVSPDEAATERAWNLKRGGEPFGPRYNAAPTQLLPIVRVHPERCRELALLRWGLIPSWAKDQSIGAKCINARAETIAEKPAYRAAFKRRRCFVPKAGFYEWQKTPSGKVPHFIYPLNTELFAVAGIYEWWPGKDGAESVESYAVVTTEANEMLARLHDRMPVILDEADYDAWLSPDNQDTAALKALLKPYPAEEMAAYAVSTRVNSVKNDDETLTASLVQSGMHSTNRPDVVNSKRPRVLSWTLRTTNRTRCSRSTCCGMRTRTCAQSRCGNASERSRNYYVRRVSSSTRWRTSTAARRTTRSRN